MEGPYQELSVRLSTLGASNASGALEWATHVTKLLVWLDINFRVLLNHPFARWVLFGQQWLHPWIENRLMECDNAEATQIFLTLANADNKRRILTWLETRIHYPVWGTSDIPESLRSHGRRSIRLKLGDLGSSSRDVQTTYNILSLHHNGFRFAPNPSESEWLDHFYRIAETDTMTLWLDIARQYASYAHPSRAYMYRQTPFVTGGISPCNCLRIAQIYNTAFLNDSPDGDAWFEQEMMFTLSLETYVLERCPWQGNRWTNALHRAKGHGLTRRAVIEMFYMPRSPVQVLRFWLAKHHYEDIVDMVDVWLGWSRNIPQYRSFRNFTVDRLLHGLSLRRESAALTMTRTLCRLLPPRMFARSPNGALVAAAWILEYLPSDSRLAALPGDLRSLVASFLWGRGIN